MIENMAQSAALRVGYISISAGKSVPLGFIGSVGKCEIARKARIGEELHTKVTIVTEVGNVTLAEAEVYVGDERICSCSLKIFLQQ